MHRRMKGRDSIVLRREPGELKHLSSRRKRKQKDCFLQKTTVISRVAASEMEGAQTGMRGMPG